MRRWLGGTLGVALAALCGGMAAGQQFTPSGSPGASAGLFGIFDEVRVGAVFPMQGKDDQAVIIAGQIYFRAFGPTYQNYFANTLLRPRVHLGANVATSDDGIDQIYGGLTWHFPVFNPFFIEASFGGTWHDGPLRTPGGDGLNLGCDFLFRESVGPGVDLGDHWTVVASVDHSSHAGLCDGGNSGITHVGVYAGYRF